MSTRKVKDAKDLETDELIYFKGHAKATYMSDGRSVEEAINDVGTGGGGGVTTETDPIFSASAAAKITDGNISTWNGKQDKISDLETIRSGAAKGATAIQQHQSLDGYTKDADLASVAKSGSYNDLSNKPTIPSAVTEDTVSGWGFTKNQGTYVKPSSGIPLSDLTDKAQESIGKGAEAYGYMSVLNSTVNGKQDKISDLSTIRSGAALGATAVQPGSLASVATSGSYNDLKDKPTIPSAVTESIVSEWGFTKNQGTYVKPSSGIPLSDLGDSVQEKIGKGAEAYNYNLILNTAVKGKQDKIADLDAIRSGAALGATALQEHQDISGKQDKIQVVSKGTSDTAFTIEPNKFYVWGSVSSLDITLGTPSDSSVYNEYLFQFTSGSTATTLSLPSSVKWQSEPKVEANKTYQVSIVDNIGLIVGV